MDKSNKDKLLEEAADIFVSLRDAPSDVDLLKDRDAFLARGEAEKEAYRTIERAWTVSAPNKKRSLPPTGAFVLMLLGGAFAAYAWDARHTFYADFISKDLPKTVVLASGDLVVLDAETAIIDQTENSERVVTLLEGAGYFAVEPSDAPFSVKAGPTTTRVLGTEFEVTRLDGGYAIAVYEGTVEVSGPSNIEVLNAGEQFVWSRGEGMRKQVGLSDIANWRDNRLSVEDMSVRQVADVIERRIRGSVFVPETEMAVRRITGSFDLSEPRLALDALAATVGGRVIAAQPFGAILVPSK
ncbi:MAG: FecR domain-containing protein [Pseudomonadota bacterium]